MRVGAVYGHAGRPRGTTELLAQAGRTLCMLLEPWTIASVFDISPIVVEAMLADQGIPGIVLAARTAA